jgi:hypothetical protein
MSLERSSCLKLPFTMQVTSIFFHGVEIAAQHEHCDPLGKGKGYGRNPLCEFQASFPKLRGLLVSTLNCC